MRAARSKNRKPTSRRKTTARALHCSSLHFEIPSTYPKVRHVHRQIMKLVHRCGYHDRSVFAIRLALQEALVNAIEHGNKLDPHKKVRIDAKITPRQAEIIIEDQGPGFDPRSLPDPRLDENLAKPEGRGILLMETFMNRVQFSRGGRRVRLVKKNEPC